MSLNKFFIALFILGFSTLTYTKLKPQRSRSIAAVGFAGIPQSEYTSRGIIDRIIGINLTAQPATQETQQITADVTMPFDYDDELRFKWTLGENVKLVSGSLTGKIDHLKNNIAKKVTIEVTGFNSTGNHHIGFEIGGKKNSRIIHGDSLLASQMDKTFESIVQNVERIKEEQLVDDEHE